MVVLSPDHGRSFDRLDDGQLDDVLGVVVQRVRHHLASGRQYVQVLVNHGRKAGASIEHPHLQLVAIDLPPPTVVGEAERLSECDACLLCDAVERDGDGELAVCSSDDAAAWCPWWSGVPFEMLVAPRRHEARLETSADLGAVARTLRAALVRLDATLGDPPYNVVFHSAPRPGGDAFHWHVHVWPRLTILAGFEQGTGVLVNIEPPEQAAPALRGDS